MKRLYRFDETTQRMIEIKEAPGPREIHSIITDEIEPIQSPLEEKKTYFTSKSTYRRHIKAKGFKETGGEHLKEKESVEDTHAKEREARKDREQMEAAYMDVKYDKVPFSERQKELYRQEERKWGKKHYIMKPPI